MGETIEHLTTVTPRPRSVGGFMSYKCTSPIVFPDRCCRDALIQATLDRQVQSLAPSTERGINLPNAIFSFEAVMGGKLCLIEVCDITTARRFQPPDRYDLGFTLSRNAVLSEPQLSSARTIWACKDLPVPAKLQIELIRHLAPHQRGLRLLDLENLLAWDLSKWVDLALALVCRGTLQIESLVRINGQTRLLSRPAHFTPTAAPERL